MKSLEKVIKASFISILKFLLNIREKKFPPQKSIKKILIIRQHNELGSILCTVPLLRAIRNSFPKAILHLVVKSTSFPVMLNNPYVNKVIEYDNLLYSRSSFKILKFIKELRKERYDLAIVPATLSVSFTSDLIAYFSKSKFRVGPRCLNGEENPSGFIYNIPVDLNWNNDPRRHQIQRNMDIIKFYNIKTLDFTPIIGLIHEESIYAETFIKRNNPKNFLSIGIHPGAGSEDNTWPMESFVEVIKFLKARYNAAIFITCGPKDIKIVNSLEFILNNEIVIIKEKSLRNIAAIIDKLDLFITNATDIMHIAASTKCPVISLFGHTDPLQWAPLSEPNKYIRGKNNDIKNISIEEVLAEVYNILNYDKRNIQKDI
jgi:ADP-heptose:LPS heptosyltransferase